MTSVFHLDGMGTSMPLTRVLPRRWAVYFDFFGTRFFGPDRPDGSASSPRHGQASLKASKTSVMPASFNRSGFCSRYRNRTLALAKVLPSSSAIPSFFEIKESDGCEIFPKRIGSIFLALRGKRLIKAWVRCWYEFEIYWFLMFSAG